MQLEEENEEKESYDKAVQTIFSNSNVQIYALRKKIKSLQQKVRRKNSKIENMRDLIIELRKNSCSNESLDDVLKNYFEGKQKSLKRNFTCSYIF